MGFAKTIGEQIVEVSIDNLVAEIAFERLRLPAVANMGIVAAEMA